MILKKEGLKISVAKHEQGKRFEFTVRFLETVKATDKKERYTGAKTSGLTLAVKPSKRKKEGSKLWRLRLANGKAQMISLGAFPLSGRQGDSSRHQGVHNQDLPRAHKKRLPAITVPEQLGEVMDNISMAKDLVHQEKSYSTIAALQIVPYLFVRPGELLKARWEESNFKKAEWYIPGDKMKRHDHVVPLSKQALALIEDTDLCKSVRPFAGAAQRETRAMTQERYTFAH